MNNETINIYWVYFPGARDVIGNKTNFQLCYIPCEEKTKQKKAVKQINTCLWVIKAENKNKAKKGNKDYWECCFIWSGLWRLIWEGSLLGPVEDPKEVRGRAVQMYREGTPPSGRSKCKDPDARVSLLFEEQQGFQWGWSRDHWEWRGWGENRGRWWGPSLVGHGEKVVSYSEWNKLPIESSEWNSTMIDLAV